jgi:ribosomal-protein-alanine N-acetyltransferase
VFTILPATWRDINELHHLEKVCFDRDAWPFLDLFVVLTFPTNVRYKAVVNDRMVGFIAGDPGRRDGVGWVTTVGVLPEYRNQGIATALLAACENALQMPAVRLCVRRSNQDAQHLYVRLGYQQISTWRNYYSGKEDALVFEKTVDS